MQLRLFDLMAAEKVTQYQLSKAIGVSTGNISDWKSGRSAPKAEALAKIADYFHVSTDYLLGRTDDKTPPSAAGADPLRSILLDNFDQLNQEGREHLVETSDDMVSSGKYKKSGQDRLGSEKMA